MLTDYLRRAGSEVPIKRLGDGYYLFGTRKIYAKIINGKLVVRVGGGYMNIEEFVATYSDHELARLKTLMDKEGVDWYEDLSIYKNNPGEGIGLRGSSRCKAFYCYALDDASSPTLGKSTPGSTAGRRQTVRSPK